jgi:multimeric flavodoxin WrbA
MKVLSVIGSRRKKNTYNAVKLFEDEFLKNNCDEFKYLFLNEFNLEYCRGCGLCVENEKSCPIKDDYKKIYEDITSSDVVIFASPIYENNISAIMKNFFDRFHYLGFRPFIKRKSAIVLSLCSFSGMKLTLNYMEWAAEIFGFNVIGKYGFKSSYLNNENSIDKLNKIIRLLLEKKSVNKEYKNKSFYKLLIFKDQKEMVLKVKNKYPKVYQYWNENGWLNKDYYYDVKINIFKKLLLKFLKLPLSRN